MAKSIIETNLYLSTAQDTIVPYKSFAVRKARTIKDNEYEYCIKLRNASNGIAKLIIFSAIPSNDYLGNGIDMNIGQNITDTVFTGTFTATGDTAFIGVFDASGIEGNVLVLKSFTLTNLTKNPPCYDTVTTQNGYAYRYNGQKTSPEIASGHQTALYWEYDSRTGRRWNLDPKFNSSESRYSTFGLNPIWHNDLLGDYKTKLGAMIGKLFHNGTIEKMNNGKYAIVDYSRGNFVETHYGSRDKVTKGLDNVALGFSQLGSDYAALFKSLTNQKPTEQGNGIISGGGLGEGNIGVWGNHKSKTGVWDYTSLPSMGPLKRPTSLQEYHDGLIGFAQNYAGALEKSRDEILKRINSNKPSIDYCLDCHRNFIRGTNEVTGDPLTKDSKDINFDIHSQKRTAP